MAEPAGPDAAVGPAPDTTPGTGAPGRPSIGWTELVVAVVAYLVMTSVAVILAGLVTGGRPGTVPLTVAIGLGTLAAVAVTLAVRVRSLAAVGLRPTTARWLLLGVGAGLLAYLLNRLVIIAYVAITGDESNPQANLAGAAAGPGLELAGLLLAGAVLVPFAEELLFRGIGYGALRRYGVAVATIVSALLFGVAHGINVVLPAAILLGVINALLYERSRSIWPAAVAHGVNNATAFVLAAILA